MKKRIVSLLTNKHIRKNIGYTLFVLFSLSFVFYIKNNPGVLEPISNINFFILCIILILYVLFLFSNLMLTKVSVSYFKKQISFYEASLLTAYSTLVNFFGPLQSGPGYRAIYLKAKHGIKIKDYSLLSVLYYLAFGVLSIIMLLSTKPVILVFSLVSAVIFLVIVRIKGSVFGYSSGIINKIFFITAAQLTIITIIYFIELGVVGPSPSLTSVVTYTGSANLALFVAFTPGAIGIRESFILISQSLHKIPSEQVIAASVLDRSIYFLFLMGLFVLSSSLHIKQKLSSPKPSL